jgi:hypothetical protein
MSCHADDDEHAASKRSRERIARAVLQVSYPCQARGSSW